MSVIDFKITRSTKINDVRIIRPSVFNDNRGAVWTSYTNDELGALLPNGLFFKHDKFFTSNNNVLRGIHGDYKSWKLMSCVSGNIFHIILDMRENSKTFQKWEAFDLDSDNPQMIIIPPGLGSAFYVKSDQAVYHCKLAYEGDYADVEGQFSVRWDDPKFDIEWPTSKPILSERDWRL